MSVIGFELGCAGCGYDLKGSGLGAVCPECGRPVAQSCRREMVMFLSAGEHAALQRHAGALAARLTVAISMLVGVSASAALSSPPVVRNVLMVGALGVFLVSRASLFALARAVRAAWPGARESALGRGLGLVAHATVWLWLVVLVAGVLLSAWRNAPAGAAGTVPLVVVLVAGGLALCAAHGLVGVLLGRLMSIVHERLGGPVPRGARRVELLLSAALWATAAGTMLVGLWARSVGMESLGRGLSALAFVPGVLSGAATAAALSRTAQRLAGSPTGRAYPGEAGGADRATRAAA